jgi:hypothetical protein
VEFSEAYFNLALQQYESGHGYLLKKGFDWIFATGPCAASSLPCFAEVRLREWPFRLYSRWAEWNEFVSGKFRDDLIGGGLEVAEQIMTKIIKLAPDLTSLMRLLELKRYG